jgi:tRNA(Ile)-lysidine synthase
MEKTDQNLAWFDVDSLELPLVVRVRKPGERFNPLGMGGHSIKVSEFMINEKIPQRARGEWPLVLSGKDVIWIPGIRQSDMGRITPTTKKLVRLTLTRDLNTE